MSQPAAVLDLGPTRGDGGTAQRQRKPNPGVGATAVPGHIELPGIPGSWRPPRLCSLCAL